MYFVSYNSVNEQQSVSFLFIEGSVIWPLENITVMEGTNVILNCSTTPGIPMPSVSWLEVNTGNRSFENPLVLTSVSRDKAGEYKCEASNVCKNDSKSSILIVNCKYEILKFSKIE